MATGHDANFRRKFEFRKLLQQLSSGLGAENVRALKNLCYDVIPKTQVESIDSGLDIFNILIEQDTVSAEKVGFLCELMDEIGRKDLSTLVKSYVELTEAPYSNPSPYVVELDMVTLGRLAGEVGKEWKMVARYLGLDETTIDSISRAHQDSLHEAALQALRKWKENAGKDATPNALKKALVEMKLMAIVHKYFV